MFGVLAIVEILHYRGLPIIDPAYIYRGFPKYELNPAAIQILELGMYAYEGTKREKGKGGVLKVCANIWRNMYLIGNSSYSGILMQSKCTRSLGAL